MSRVFCWNSTAKILRDPLRKTWTQSASAGETQTRGERAPETLEACDRSKTETGAAACDRTTDRPEADKRAARRCAENARGQTMSDKIYSAFHDWSARLFDAIARRALSVEMLRVLRADMLRTIEAIDRELERAQPAGGKQ